MEVIKNYAEDELLLAIQNDINMDGAIRYLYRTYFEGLSIYVQQNQGSRQDAEDIFQDALVILCKKVQSEKQE